MKRFRLLQFNMQFGQVWDEHDPDRAPIDLAATVREIQRHEADVITLQEVERAQPGGHQIEPPPNFSRLREALPGYHAYFAYPRPDPRELPFGLGLAIFSRTPLYDTLQLDLPSPPVEFEFDGETKTPTDRLLIGARTRIGDHELTIYDTHLLAFFMLKTSSETHGDQRRRIEDLLAQAKGPTVLAGDFNVSRPGPLIAQFASVGFHTVQDTEITWRRQPFVLDHVFHNDGLRVARHQVVQTMASDHHPLVVDLEFAN